MGIQINGNTNNINAGIGSLSIEDLNELDIVGVATASNFKTGSSNLHSTGLTVGNALVHSTGINVGTGATVHCPSTNTLTFGTNSAERLRIDSNGNIGVGIAPSSGARFWVASNQNPIVGTRYNAGADGSVLFLQHSRSNTIGTNAALNDNDEIGAIQFRAYNSGNSSIKNAAFVKAEVNGTTGSSGVPADLIFGTGTNSSNALERLRIDSAGRVMIGTTTEGNVNADDLTIANSGEGGITIRSGSSSNGNIFFSDATSGAGEYAGIIDYKHSSNVMTFGVSGTERLRITEGGAEQATLVIDNSQTNGNTWIGDNYTANATEHTCTIGNMYSGAGLFFGYNMKPQSNGWGFVSCQDAYSDRRAGMTLNGSGYDALRIDVTNANQTITTGDPVTTVKAFAVKHNGDVEIPDGNLVVASGHGIDFSATGNSSGSMSAELFDDYEEGTFVPGTSGYTTASKTAQYTKIGNTVHYQIQLATIGGSASFIIGNLPFAVNAGWGGTIGITNHGGQDHVYPFPHQGMTSMYVRNSSNTTYGTTNSIIAGKFFYIWGTYITNA